MALKLSGPASLLCATFQPVAASGFIALLDSSSLWTPFLVNAAIQLIGYLHSAFNHTERWYDACGSLGFIASSLTSLALCDDSSVRNWIDTGLVVIWAARLGRHLVSRIQKDSHDKRFDSMRDSGAKLALPWSMQLLWVTLVPSAVLLMNLKAHTQEPIGVRDIVGWAIWLFGFLFESIADEQKKDFRSNPENRDKFIQTGLWSRSRHPNYFGEMTLWFGVWLSCSTVFDASVDYATIAGPLFNCFILRFVSGVPLLETSADKKWGSSPDYIAYKANTPLLIPKLF